MTDSSPYSVLRTCNGRSSSQTFDATYNQPDRGLRVCATQTTLLLILRCSSPSPSPSPSPSHHSSPSHSSQAPKNKPPPKIPKPQEAAALAHRMTGFSSRSIISINQTDPPASPSITSLPVGPGAHPTSPPLFASFIGSARRHRQLINATPVHVAPMSGQ